MSKKVITDVMDRVLANQNMPDYTIGEILELMETDPDIDGAIIGGFSTRMQCYADGLAAGILTLDEVRKLEKLPKLT